MSPSVVHKVGLNLHPAHFNYLEEKPATEVAWFEAISENHMHGKGYTLEILQLVRQNYPVALQGFSMNIGSSEGVCLNYLQNLRDLTDRVDPFLIADHLCWTGISDSKWHGLFPLPFTKESIRTVVKNIDFVQNFLRRPIALKNISSYISFQNNEMAEWEFIAEIIHKSGCKFVLDLNSLYINSKNQNYDLTSFLDNIPFDHVAQVQLAGPIDFGDFYFDSRSQEVPEFLWDLFQSLAPKIRHLPILISRTEDIPPFTELESEVIKAAFILENSYETKRITEVI